MPHYPADALAAVTDPARVNYHPALMQDAWCRLKQARGAPLSQGRLARLEPAHLIAATPANSAACATVQDLIAPHQQGAMARVRAMMCAAKAATTGGDAA